MKVKKNTIRLQTSEWKFKVNTEGRRMKIYIKLTQEEGERWTSIKGAITGGGKPIPDSEFAKIILFRGLNAFMDDITSALDDMDDDEKAKLYAEAGIEEQVDIQVPEIPKLGPTSDIKDAPN